MPRILTVDDSKSMRQMLAFTLRSAGHEVTEAVDGQDAWERANDPRGPTFDVILTDQNMPRMDGITLTKKLRGVSRYNRTPILILTTEASDDMKQSGRSAGATGWMVKPFDPNVLLDVIGRVMR